MTKSPLFAYLDRRHDSVQPLRATMSGAGPEAPEQPRPGGLTRSRMSQFDTVFAWIAVAVLAAVIAIVLDATLTT